MANDAGTSAGERLLRSAAVARAASAVQEEVRGHLATVLHGPFATALAGGNMAPSSGAQDQANRSGEAPREVLAGDIPRRFIAAGAALTVASGALAQGDETRTAGALLCAEQILFPQDAPGVAAVAAATRGALSRMGGDVPAADPAAAALQVQRQLQAACAHLERAFRGAAGHLETAMLSTVAWRLAAGGFGGDPGVARARFGPFVDGIVRWAFFVEAALAAIRADNWLLAGAALVTAGRDVRLGSADFTVIPPS